jgi:hypothetical protein
MVMNPLCASYFSVLHSILGIMAKNREDDCTMSREFRARIARTPWEWEEQPPRFERCEPVQRQYLLQAVLDLFRSWPTAFVQAFRACKIKSSAIFDPPPWMWHALVLATGRAALNIEYIRAEFWKAAEAEGWSQAAELLNGSPRNVEYSKKFPPKSVTEPTDVLNYRDFGSG